MNKNSQQPLAIEIAIPIEAEISALPPIQFHGVKVLTTELVARFFGCEIIRIQQSLTRNKNRFELEKHFFEVVGNELKSFKNQYANSTNYQNDSQLLISKNTPKLILWTKRGVALLAKIIDTDQAWNVIEKLVDFYFDVQEKQDSFVSESPKSNLKYSLKFISDEFDASIRIIKHFDVKGNQATLSACQMIRKVYDVDILSLTGQTKGLISESQQHDFSPTEIGGMLKPVQSARKVNQLLVEAGYQTRANNPKLNRVVYQVTDLGKSFAILKDTTKKHSDGTPILQVRWFEKIVEFLQSRVVI